MGQRLVCLGDSNTEGIGDQLGIGWPGRLAGKLAHSRPDQWSVINLGVAGDTSLDIKHRFLSEVLYREPARLIIAAGVNDTAQRQWPDARGAKVELTYAKTVWMDIMAAIKRTGIKTAFVSPLPVDEARMPLIYMPYDDLDKGHLIENARVRDYNAMLSGLVKENGFEWVDVYSQWVSRPLDKLLSDGLHPNAEGYDLLVEDIRQVLEAQGFLD